MNAALLKRERNIEIIELEYPNCKDNEIIVKIIFSGICGSDLSTFRGLHPYKKPPVILGHEASGVVDKVGKSAKKFKVGDRVCIQSFVPCGKCRDCADGMDNLCQNKKILNYKNFNGSFAEYLVAEEGLFFKIPDNITYQEGALVEPLSIALHAIRNVGEVANKNIAILGTGTNGLSTLICLKNMGVNSVLCTDIHNSKGERAKSFGCDYFINVRDEVIKDKSLEYVPEGFDIIFISTSYPAVLNDAIAISKKGAIIIVVSYLGPDTNIDHSLVVRNELTIRGSALSNPNDMELIIDWINKKEIQPLPMVTNEYNLHECHKALELFDDTNQDVGKILINCNTNK
tara:strand:- start:244 stop:1275 length:1032 start_codon:yes stop_codon:yes gene_type:complete